MKTIYTFTANDRAALVQNYHTARSALAAEAYTRHDRMCWAVKTFVNAASRRSDKLPVAAAGMRYRVRVTQYFTSSESTWLEIDAADPLAVENAAKRLYMQDPGALPFHWEAMVIGNFPTLCTSQ